jgi:hypothetical protein
MRPSAKVVGLVCLVTGLAVGVLVGSRVAQRRGHGHQEEGQPAEQGHQEGGKPAEREDPEVSTWFDPASSLLAAFARGADGLSPGGGRGKSSAGHEPLFDRRLTRWYFVLSGELTLDPKFQKSMRAHIRELEQQLTGLAREKGVVVQESGDGHAVRQLDGGPQWVGPRPGPHNVINDAREGFRYQYSTGNAHGVVQVQADYLGKRGKGDEEVAVYYYEARVEEWAHARRP